MLSDLAGALAALGLFPLLLIAPGLVLGWTTDCFRYRRASPPLRLLAALLLSVGSVPIAAYWLVRFGGFTAAWIALAAVLLAALPILPRAFPTGARGTFGGLLRERWAWLILVFWVIGAYLWSMDLIRDGRLAMSTMTYDRVGHVGVTDAISRTGLPPVNPFYHPGEAVPLYYYYFWFLLTSLIDQMGGALVGPRQAVQASVIWGGLAFFAAFLLWLRRLGERGIIPRSYGVPLALLLVTGLDLLAWAVLLVAGRVHGEGPKLIVNSEWWNEQVSAWGHALLWVPHHMAAFAASLAAFLWLRQIEDEGGARRRDAVVLGVIFASAAGMSVWVTLTAALIFAVWAVDRLRRGGLAALGPHAAIAVVSALLVSPLAIDMFAANQRDAWPLAFAVREFYPATRMEEWFHVPFACDGWCLLALLPLNYALELGFFALAAYAYWTRMREPGPLSHDERLLVTMAAVSVLLCTFFRADVGANDLGWRGFMFAQFALLIWAVKPARAIWSSRPSAGRVALSGPWRAVLGTTLVVGALGTVGDLWLLRLMPPDALAFARRLTYEWIERNTPASTVLQHNPDVTYDTLNGLYSHRQVVMADSEFGALYGVDTARAEALRAELAALFTAEASLADARAAACRFRIDLFLVKAGDGAWSAGDSWVWRTPARFETEWTRVIAATDVAKAAGGPCP